LLESLEGERGTKKLLQDGQLARELVNGSQLLKILVILEWFISFR
jgi:hypothetical protein